MSGAMFLLCWLFVWGFPAAELTGCCYCRVAQSYLTLCNPMDCSTPGFRRGPSGLVTINQQLLDPGSWVSSLSTPRSSFTSISSSGILSSWQPQRPGNCSRIHSSGWRASVAPWDQTWPWPSLRTSLKPQLQLQGRVGSEGRCCHCLACASRSPTL